MKIKHDLQVTQNQTKLTKEKKQLYDYAVRYLRFWEVLSPSDRKENPLRSILLGLVNFKQYLRWFKHYFKAMTKVR